MAYIKLIVETYILCVHSETFALLAVKHFLPLLVASYKSDTDSSLRSEWRSHQRLD